MRRFERLLAEDNRRPLGNPRPSQPAGDPPPFRPHHAAVRAALRLQRVRQQLFLLRVLARRGHPAHHAQRRAGRARGAAPARSGLPQPPAGGRRTPEIRLRRLPAGLPGRPQAVHPHPRHRGRADGGRSIRGNRRPWRGRVGRLSGNLRPRGLSDTAHRRAEEELRLAAQLSGARLCRRVPPHRHRRVVRPGGLALRGAGAVRPSGIPLQTRVESPAHRRLSAHAALCRQL